MTCSRSASTARARVDEGAIERVVAFGAVEQAPGDSGVRVVDEQRHRAQA